MKEDKRKEQLGNPLTSREPETLFDEIIIDPAILDDLNRRELNKAKRQGNARLKEIDRYLNDAIDTIDRKHERSGDVDELGLPTSPHYAKEVKHYNDWHKKAKEQAEGAISAIEKSLETESKIKNKLNRLPDYLEETKVLSPIEKVKLIIEIRERSYVKNFDQAIQIANDESGQDTYKNYNSFKKARAEFREYL